MIPELGHFSLILALCIAVALAYFSLVGAATGRLNWLAVAKPAARAQFGFMLIAFLALTWSFVANDFSVSYVAQNSNSQLPLSYRISAVWGGHEGSLLLWGLILAFWCCAVSFFSGALPQVFVARVLGVMGLISVGFVLFMLFTSNPFERLSPVPMDGADLNPLLQDFGLIVHPPMLYMGYVGFSVAFAFAIAALLGGNLDAGWARWSRPWTIIAWVFLTLGIALGSWWAYYELGWGGWWFWDPVENASFMPWLAGTALLHSLAASEKRGVFKSWTVLLAICTFSLSLLGTFLVRSGVLTSVHAFASDPTRGVFILVFLAVVVGGSLTLYAFRAPGNLKGARFSYQSREMFLLMNNVLLVVAMASILLGTIYPLIIDALGLGKLSVGAPYFNAVFVPVIVCVAVFMVPGTLLRWRNDRLARLKISLGSAFIGALVLGAICTVLIARITDWKALLGIILFIWIIWGMAGGLVGRVVARKSMPLSFWGMSVAHVGLAVTILGVTLSSNYSEEMHVRMGPGDIKKLGDFEFQMGEIETLAGPNYDAARVLFTVTRDGKSEGTLQAEKRQYRARGMPMTEAGIGAGFSYDLYVALGEKLEDGDWSVRLYYKPFIRWVWLGAIFMALGGVLAAADRRYRLKKESKVIGTAGQPEIRGTYNEGVGL